MTKLEMLFIRACKSEEPFKRIASVYRRFYTKYEGEFEKNITMILAGIVEDCGNLSLTRFINDSSSYEIVNMMITKEREYPHWERNTRALIKHFRFIDKDFLIGQGYIIPKRFR